MNDIAELLEAARRDAEPAGPPLADFVEQLRSAGVRLDLAPADLEESVATASLTIPENGGAIRTVIGAGRAHSMGVYASTKNGYLQPYDGRIERSLIHWCEADGRVVYYQAQPCVLAYRTPTGNAAWLPDLWRQLRCGTLEMIEVKRSRRDLLKPGYAAKLACAAAVATSLGYRFRLMYRAEILGNVHRRYNLARIQARRNVVLDAGALDRFEALATAGRATDVGSVRRALHDDVVRGMAGVHRLIASGRILVDMDRHLSDASPVEVTGAIAPSRILL